MNKIFQYGMIIFIAWGLLTGHSETLFQGMLETPFSVLELTLKLVVTACFWNGILNMMMACGLVEILSHFIRPLMNIVYGHHLEEKTIQLLTSNLVANLLGMGSLATISGLKAIKALDRGQKLPSREMIILVVINTAGLSLIPSTIMTLRQSFHTKLSSGFFLYSICIGLIITIIGIIIVHICDRDG